MSAPPVPPLLLVAFALLGALLLSGCGRDGPGAGGPPSNFLFILVDDMAWTGTSVQMDPDRADSRSDYYRTPNLERLAAQSMIFTDAYAPSPICSPSRASLLTGKSPQRLKLTDVTNAADLNSPIRVETNFGMKLSPAVPLAGLPEIHVTIAEALKAANPDYVTAHFGKWHLGNKGPESHGFDESDGNTDNPDGYVGDPDPKKIFSVTSRSVEFLEQRKKDGRPFYLQVSHYAVHDPFDSLDASLEAWQGRAPGQRHGHALFAAMTEDLDTGVGQLLDALERLGLAETTYVIFSSDNGGIVSKPDEPGRYNNLPLARGKATVYEGGIRVPLLVRGAGVQPAVYCRVPIIGWDFFPTVLDLAGVRAPLPDEVEGGSFAGLLRQGGQGQVTRPHPALVWHFPHYAKWRDATPASAIRVGQMKLVHDYEESKVYLYDLDADLEEQTDLSAKRPRRAVGLNAGLSESLSRVNAPMPFTNPNFPNFKEK